MGEINYQRLFAGGLLAGVLFVIGETLFSTIFSGAVAQWMQTMNLTEPTGGAMVGLVLLTLSLGLGAVWLYAAIRPRFGPGPVTAAIAGVVIWALAVVFPALTYVFFGVPIDGGFWLYVTWWLVVGPAATIAGAWVYQELGEEKAAADAPIPVVAPEASPQSTPLQ
jgi:hypothetical protein